MPTGRRAHPGEADMIYTPRIIVSSAIRELIRQMAMTLREPGAAVEPDVFLTSGAAPAVAGLLDFSARCVPELTLAGIALAARAMSRT